MSKHNCSESSLPSGVHRYAGDAAHLRLRLLFADGHLLAARPSVSDSRIIHLGGTTNNSRPALSNKGDNNSSAPYNAAFLIEKLDEKWTIRPEADQPGLLLEGSQAANGDLEQEQILELRVASAPLSRTGDDAYCSCDGLANNDEAVDNSNFVRAKSTLAGAELHVTSGNNLFETSGTSERQPMATRKCASNWKDTATVTSDNNGGDKLQRTLARKLPSETRNYLQDYHRRAPARRNYKALDVNLCSCRQLKIQSLDINSRQSATVDCSVKTSSLREDDMTIDHDSSNDCELLRSDYYNRWLLLNRERHFWPFYNQQQSRSSDQELIESSRSIGGSRSQNDRDTTSTGDLSPHPALVSRGVDDTVEAAENCASPTDRKHKSPANKSSESQEELSAKTSALLELSAADRQLETETGGRAAKSGAHHMFRARGAPFGTDSGEELGAELDDLANTLDSRANAHKGAETQAARDRPLSLSKSPVAVILEGKSERSIGSQPPNGNVRGEPGDVVDCGRCFGCGELKTGETAPQHSRGELLYIVLEKHVKTVARPTDSRVQTNNRDLRLAPAFLASGSSPPNTANTFTADATGTGTATVMLSQPVDNNNGNRSRDDAEKDSKVQKQSSITLASVAVVSASGEEDLGANRLSASRTKRARDSSSDIIVDKDATAGVSEGSSPLLAELSDRLLLDLSQALTKETGSSESSGNKEAAKCDNDERQSGEEGKVEVKECPLVDSSAASDLMISCSNQSHQLDSVVLASSFPMNQDSWMQQRHRQQHPQIPEQPLSQRRAKSSSLASALRGSESKLLCVIAIDALNRSIQLKPDLNQLISIHHNPSYHELHKAFHPVASGSNSATSGTSRHNMSRGDNLTQARAIHWPLVYMLELLSRPEPSASRGEAERELDLLYGRLLRSPMEISTGCGEDGEGLARSSPARGFVSPRDGSVLIKLQFDFHYAAAFPADCRDLYAKYKIMADCGGKWKLSRHEKRGRSGAGEQSLKADTTGSTGSAAGLPANFERRAPVTRSEEHDFGKRASSRNTESRLKLEQMSHGVPKKASVASELSHKAQGNKSTGARQPDGSSPASAESSGRAAAPGAGSELEDEGELLLEGSTVSSRADAFGRFHFACVEQLVLNAQKVSGPASRSPAAVDGRARAVDREESRNGRRLSKQSRSAEKQTWRQQTSRSEPAKFINKDGSGGNVSKEGDDEDAVDGITLNAADKSDDEKTLVGRTNAFSSSRSRAVDKISEEDGGDKHHTIVESNCTATTHSTDTDYHDDRRRRHVEHDDDHQEENVDEGARANEGGPKGRPSESQSAVAQVSGHRAADDKQSAKINLTQSDRLPGAQSECRAGVGLGLESDCANDCQTIDASAAADEDADRSDEELLLFSLLFEFYSTDFYHDKLQGWAHLSIPVALNRGGGSRAGDNGADGDGSSSEKVPNVASSALRPRRQDVQPATQFTTRHNANRYEIPVIRWQLLSFIDRLRYYLIGQLPRSSPKLKDFVRSDLRYMLQTKQNGRMVLDCEIVRQFSDPNFDSALKELQLIGRRPSKTDPLTFAWENASQSSRWRQARPLSDAVPTDEQEQDRRDGTRVSQLGVHQVVEEYQRAKTRFSKLNTSELFASY